MFNILRYVSKVNVWVLHFIWHFFFFPHPNLSRSADFYFIQNNQNNKNFLYNCFTYFRNISFVLEIQELLHKVIERIPSKHYEILDYFFLFLVWSWKLRIEVTSRFLTIQIIFFFPFLFLFTDGILGMIFMSTQSHQNFSSCYQTHYYYQFLRDIIFF